MVVPHENAAVGMAHGYTMVTGRAQAVMLHTNVGTANSINMLIDASRDRIPMRDMQLQYHDRDDDRHHPVAKSLQTSFLHSSLLKMTDPKIINPLD